MKGRRGRGLVLSACPFLLVLAAAGQAFGAPAPPSAPPQRTDGDPWETFRWDWRTTGSDPFEIGWKRKVVDKPPPVDQREPLGPLPRGPLPPDAPKPEVVRHNATLVCDRAELLLGANRYAKAAEICERAAKELRDVGLHETPLAERVERFMRTAQRLKFRQEVEQEFRNLRIELKGIIWEPEKASALINGQIVEPGDMVEGALVESIGPREVIFMLKGVRVRKRFE